MKREILFRGKRVDNREWAEGHYTQGSEKYHYITNPDGSVWEVIPETVGQFTGIRDNNGNKIFEGDKLHERDFGNVVVFFNEKVASFQFKYIAVQGNEMSVTLYEHLSKDYEITGNIHDK